MFNIISKFTPLCNGIGYITEDKPSTKNILKIFDPTTFPIARSTLFFKAAEIDVASSGREVPIDTIVRPIILSEIPIYFAKLTANITMTFPPITSIIKPNKVKSTDLKTVYSFIVISYSKVPALISERV